MTLPTVRTGSMRIARLEPDGTPGPWLDLGGTLSGLTFTPEFEQSVERFREGLGNLARTATVTVAFTPGRAMVRLLFGWAATVDRRHVRRLYRRRSR